MTYSNAAEVYLYKDGDIISRCNAVYLGLLGMQVDANPLVLPKFSPVDAVIYFDTEGNNYRLKLNAVVTSRSRKGVGLTFVNFNAHTHNKLKQLIHGIAHSTERLSTLLSPELV